MKVPVESATHLYIGKRDFPLKVERAKVERATHMYIGKRGPDIGQQCCSRVSHSLNINTLLVV